MKGQEVTVYSPLVRVGKRITARLEGRSAGACHKCGASLNVQFPRARLCPSCGTLYHTYDCGKRLQANSLVVNATDCPKVCQPISGPRAQTKRLQLDIIPLVSFV